MNSEATPFPLFWPEGQSRTQVHQRSVCRFKQITNFAAYQELHEAIRKFNGVNVIISSSTELTVKGVPLQRRPYDNDPGVVAYFQRDKKGYCIPCDAFDSYWANCHAISLTIESQRAIERWGCAGLVTKMMEGFLSLPAPARKRDWWDVLEVQKTARPEIVNTAYRSLVKIHHPDLGGDADRFNELQQALEEYEKVSTELAM